ICWPASTSTGPSRGRLPEWIRIWTTTSSTGRTDWTASSGRSCPSSRSWTAFPPDRPSDRRPGAVGCRRCVVGNRRRPLFAVVHRLDPIPDQRAGQWPGQRGPGMGCQTLDEPQCRGSTAGVDLVVDRFPDGPARSGRGRRLRRAGNRRIQPVPAACSGCAVAILGADAAPTSPLRAGPTKSSAGGYCCRSWHASGRGELGRADEIWLVGSYTNVPLTPGEEPTLLPSPSVPLAPGGSAMRRVLRRARDGVALNVDEAAIALAARGEDLADLCRSAARVRDAGLESAGRRGGTGRLPVSYSRKVFIPVTHLCRDTCHYCTFVTVPGKLRAAGMGMYMEPDEILDVARRGAELGCKEALFTLGDRPEARWDEARQWLDERGYDSTLDYVRAMAIRVREETGLLPHLNPGVMSWSELSRLKPVAPSMGMMLETTSRRLFETKGLAHYGSPDKDPVVRLRTLDDAGRLAIPFTTGLLVGIGETLVERAETMHAIRSSHKEFGHVQEVIVQNFRAKDHTAMAGFPDAGIEDYLATVAVTRLVMGPKMVIQAPPNLVSRAECLALIGAGVDDWGGVSP